MAMKFFLFNIIMTPTPPSPFDSVSMMQGECFYCTLDVYCTIFMCVCVCFVLTSVMGWVCKPLLPPPDKLFDLQGRSIRIVTASKYQ